MRPKARASCSPFEQATSKYIEKLQNFVHFLPRRLALTEQAPSFLAFKGGFGTLNELFEVLRTGQPVLLEGKNFWGAMDKALKGAWKQHALVPDEALNRLILNDDGWLRGLPAVVAAALERGPASAVDGARHRDGQRHRPRAGDLGSCPKPR